jgi:hypothetical protein
LARSRFRLCLRLVGLSFGDRRGLGAARLGRLRLARRFGGTHDAAVLRRLCRARHRLCPQGFEPARLRNALDAWLDDEIRRSADQNQMFDIVAAHQHEPAARIERQCVEHGKARLTAALRPIAEAAIREEADQPEDQQYGQKNHDERDHELGNGRACVAEHWRQIIVHLILPTSDSGSARNEASKRIEPGTLRA